MSIQRQVEDQLLSTLRASGRSRPTQLVDAVVQESHQPLNEVREALRELVERRAVALNWQGELIPGD